MRFITVGTQVLNLANVAYVDLDAPLRGDTSSVCVVFNSQTWDEVEGVAAALQLTFPHGTPEADYLLDVFSTDKLGNL